MQSKPTESERAYVKGEWLMQPNPYGEAVYLQRYWSTEDAERAARDFNENGRALAPFEYARTRR